MNHLEIAKKWGESHLNGDWETWNNLTSDDFTLLGPAPEPLDKQAYFAWCQSVYNANSNYTNNISLREVSGDAVTGTVQMQGEHTRDWDLSFMGLGTIPATNKAWINPQEELTVTIKDGKVIKCNVVVPESGGIPGIMSQLGVEIPEEAIQE